MKAFVVFYAWQSDRPERFNRYLIRFALNLAAKNISADPTVGIRVRIDADTEGVHGHCPVTETILKKIAVCDAFVPDLTFVASTEAGKLIPNPNVMLEYGYALENFVKVVSTVMQLRPPFVVELGIVGTKGVYMGAPHPESSNGSFYGPIREDSLVRRYELAKTDRAAQRELLRDFFDELYDLAEVSRSEILTEEHVHANDIPRRT